MNQPISWDKWHIYCSLFQCPPDAGLWLDWFVWLKTRAWHIQSSGKIHIHLQLYTNIERMFHVVSSFSVSLGNTNFFLLFFFYLLVLLFFFFVFFFYYCISHCGLVDVCLLTHLHEWWTMKDAFICGRCDTEAIYLFSYYFHICK